MLYQNVGSLFHVKDVSFLNTSSHMVTENVIIPCTSSYPLKCVMYLQSATSIEESYNRNILPKSVMIRLYRKYMSLSALFNKGISIYM